MGEMNWLNVYVMIGITWHYVSSVITGLAMPTMRISVGKNHAIFIFFAG